MVNQFLILAMHLILIDWVFSSQYLFIFISQPFIYIFLIMTDQYLQTLNDQQLNLTFSQQSSRDNPQAHLTYLVDKSHKNYDKTVQPQRQQFSDQKLPYQVKNNCKQGEELTSILIDESHQHIYFLTHTPRNKNTKLHTHKQTQDNEHDEDTHRYKELTSKLQKAFNKISNGKKILNKTTGSSSHINIRFGNCEEKRKYICRKKQAMEFLKIEQVKDKPTININSSQITKAVGYEPIYIRFQKILQNKRRKMKEQQELRKKHQQDEQVKFIQEYNRHVKKPINARSYDQFFNQMLSWKEKIIEENRQKYEIQQQKQLEGITFCPTINPKSKRFVLSQQRLTIQQRGMVKKTQLK